MTKRKRFPRFVYFGFSPDGECRTNGYDNMAGAWQWLMFTFAAEVEERSHVVSPQDDEKAMRLGWSVGKRRLVSARGAKP